MRILTIACIVGLMAAPASADTIRRACLGAPTGGTPQLCACIQAAADRTLTAKDQKLAATFFQNPDRAQEIRQSDRRSHEVFWKRYRAFGDAAEAYCS